VVNPVNPINNLVNPVVSPVNIASTVNPTVKPISNPVNTPNTANTQNLVNSVNNSQQPILKSNTNVPSPDTNQVNNSNNSDNNNDELDFIDSDTPIAIPSKNISNTLNTNNISAINQNLNNTTTDNSHSHLDNTITIPVAAINNNTTPPSITEQINLNKNRTISIIISPKDIFSKPTNVTLNLNEPKTVIIDILKGQEIEANQDVDTNITIADKNALNNSNNDLSNVTISILFPKNKSDQNGTNPNVEIINDGLIDVNTGKGNESISDINNTSNDTDTENKTATTPTPKQVNNNVKEEDIILQSSTNNHTNTTDNNTNANININIKEDQPIILPSTTTTNNTTAQNQSINIQIIPTANNTNNSISPTPAIIPQQTQQPHNTTTSVVTPLINNNVPTTIPTLANRKSEFIVLGDNNYDQQVLYSNDLWFIFFYTNTSSISLELLPQWEEAASLLKGKAKLGKVDVLSNKLIRTRYSINMVPTIYIYPAGLKNDTNRIVFTGRRNTSDIVNYALNYLQLNPNYLFVEQARTEAQLREVCASRLCGVFIVPNTNNRNVYLQVMNTVKRSTIRRDILYLWANGGDMADLEQQVSVNAPYPDFIILDLTHEAYLPLEETFNAINIIRLINSFFSE
jgi:hypothetical protein